MPSRHFPQPWTVEPMPTGYRVVGANGIVLAHVYGQPDGAIAVSDTRLSGDEARSGPGSAVSGHYPDYTNEKPG